jgi:hypothetical protein
MMQNDSLLFELKSLSEGLWYMSETDAPFEVCIWGEPIEMYFKPQEPIEKQDFEAFFEPLLQMRDLGEAYQKLYVSLQNTLADLRVYWVGELRKDIYIVGKSLEGKLMGLRTFAVQT